MNVQRLVSVAAALAACYTMGACGSDKSDAGAGGAGAAKGGASGGPGSGGASTGGRAAAGSGSGGMPVTTEECVASHFSGPGITSACKSCMCQCNAAAASVCDENCWSLTRCVQVTCAGNATDFTCITAMCGAFLAGATTAAPLASCFSQCGPAQCAGWFIAGSGGAGSGGAAGGGTAGMTSSGGTAGTTSSGGTAGMTSSGGTAGTTSSGGTAGSAGASNQAGAGGEGG